MCGRCVLKATPAELITRFGLDECVDLKPRYNILPGTKIAAIRLSPEGQVLCGLVGVAGGEGGIRTLGTEEPYAGFRIRCIRPLCHLSAVIAAAYIAYFCRCLVLPVKTGLVQERAAF